MTEIGCALQERAEMLETTQWANEFIWNEIESIAKYRYISKAAKGSTFFNEWSRNAEMYLIVEGSVTVVKEDVSSREKVLSVIRLSPP